MIIHAMEIVISFNSNVVRLKDPNVKVINVIPIRFQFQCGAIKGKPYVRRFLEINLFQFQCGAIKGEGPTESPVAHSKVSIPMWCD